MTSGLRADRIAAEVIDLLGTGRQVAPISGRNEGFDIPEAYEVAARVHAARLARGERPVGRKIGFTNTAVRRSFGVHGAMWSHVYDTTVRWSAGGAGRFPLSGLAEPRIEPEIVLGLAHAPQPGMTEGELAACLGWVAHGFEIVTSVFPDWRFAAADATAAFGLHGGLFIGRRRQVPPDSAAFAAALHGFSLAVERDGARVGAGNGANVLGGPLGALNFLVEELARQPGSPPLRAGELVSTGTLTEAFPIAPGETWTTRIAGLPIAGLSVTLT